MRPQLRLSSRFTPSNRIEVIADSDDLHDTVEQAVERRNDGGGKLHGCRFAIYMRRLCRTDVPIRTAVNPNIETVRQKDLDDFRHNVVWQRTLVSYRKVGVYDHAAVECGHRHLQSE